MDDLQFFCIRGFMKSGTNWLGSLMASHESITVRGEFHWEKVALALNKLLAKQGLYREEGLNAEVRKQFQQFVKASMRKLVEPGTKWIGDRTPHSLHPVILRDAPHISIIRDGRDVLVSRIFHLFNNPQTHRYFERVPSLAKVHASFVEDPWYFNENPKVLLRHQNLVRESCRLWRNHLESDRHTLTKFPNLRTHFVHYEQLHENTDAVRKELFEFLGVDPKRAARLEGVLQPGFKKERPNEFLRKGAVGDWKNYFTDKTRQWFKEEAGEELIRQGYEDSFDW